MAASTPLVATRGVAGVFESVDFGHFETFDVLHRNGALQDLLNVLQQTAFIGTDERTGTALLSGPTGAADAVDVVFGHVGQLVVHDVGKETDVDPARGHVGGDEDADRVRLEIGEGLGAGGLALVAVDRGGGDAVDAKLLGETVGAVLRAGEDEHLAPVAFFDELGKEAAFVGFGDGVNHLRHRFGGAAAACHFDEGRITENPVGEGLDLGRISRGEEEILTTGREELEDFADVVDETHVEHAVGLIEDEDLDLGKVDRALADVVEEASRRGHEDIDPATEALDLWVDPDSAKNHGGGKVEALAIGRDAFTDLGGEFARRGEDESARAAGTRLARGEALEHRQGEGRGLARAGLRSSEEVASREDGRDGLGLDRRGRRVAFGGDGIGEGGIEAEFGEVHQLGCFARGGVGPEVAGRQARSFRKRDHGAKGEETGEAASENPLATSRDDTLKRRHSLPPIQMGPFW